MKKILIVLFVMLVSTAHADIINWDTKTKIEFGISSAAIIGDSIVTSRLLATNKVKEINPLVGSRPSDAKIIAFTALSLYINYQIFDHLDDKQRFWYFLGTTALRSYAIDHNLKVGAELKF